MTKNATETRPISTAGTHDITTDRPPSPSPLARLTARMQAGQFDRMLAVGAPVRSRGALAAHATRLTSRPERELVASALSRIVSEAIAGPRPFSSRIPLNRQNIVDTRELIDDVTHRLHAPQPVSACGVARVRRLLADGSGPLYRRGGGDLRGRLGAALAVL